MRASALRLVPAFLLAAAVVACDNKASRAGNGQDGDPVVGNTTGPADGGDGGTDGGVDAGTDGGTDGGCTSATARPVSRAVDGCYFNGQQRSATLVAAGCSPANLYLDNTLACSGTLSGPNNAFSGSCNGFASCTSTALPGTVTCTGPTGADAGTQGCQIVFCDSTGSCP